MFENSCCITGHRPKFFPFKTNEEDPLCKKIKTMLTKQIEMLYQEGIRNFYAGGAVGADMWASEAVIALKAQPQYRELKLICVIPFPGYDNEFSETEKTRNHFILQQCDEVITVSEEEGKNVYRKRNNYMVDHSFVVIAVCNHLSLGRTGTAQTVNYAKKKEKRMIYIHPHTAEVTKGE